MPTKRPPASPLPTFIKPQLALPRDEAPAGDGWVLEIKLDGYRIHARIDGRDVRLLTRTGLDWSDRYRATQAALGRLKARQAYLDGELCAVGADGLTSFAAMQAATDHRASDELVFFVFDLLHLDGENLARAPLLERKQRLAHLLDGASGGYASPSTSQGRARRCSRRLARSARRGSCQSASTNPTRRAIEASGSRANASTGKNS
jgi:ATP-dependent DNA ligase